MEIYRVLLSSENNFQVDLFLQEKIMKYAIDGYKKFEEYNVYGVLIYKLTFEINVDPLSIIHEFFNENVDVTFNRIHC